MKKVIFTKHALNQAMKRGGIDEDYCRNILISCKEMKLSKKVWNEKFAKYGMDSIRTHYLYNENEHLSFNIIEEPDCFLVITIIKKKYKKVKFKENGLSFANMEKI